MNKRQKIKLLKSDYVKFVNRFGKRQAYKLGYWLSQHRGVSGRYFYAKLVFYLSIDKLSVLSGWSYPKNKMERARELLANPQKTEINHQSYINKQENELNHAQKGLLSRIKSKFMSWLKTK